MPLLPGRTPGAPLPVRIASIPISKATGRAFATWLIDNGLEHANAFAGPWILDARGNTIAQDPRHHGGNALVLILVKAPPADLLTDLALGGHLVCSVDDVAGDHDPSVGPARCVVLVERTGRHPGDHTDGVRKWENTDPYVETDSPLFRTAPLARQPRRRGVVVLGEEQLERLVRPGPGQRIIGFAPDPIRLAVLVHLEGDGLPEVAPDSFPPEITLLGPVTTYYRLDVTGWTPERAHAAILAQLAELLEHTAPALTLLTPDVAVPAHATWIGADEIIRRHAPERANNDDLVCSHCRVDHGYPDQVPWPCPDYRAAAQGAVTGLEIPADE